MESERACCQRGDCCRAVLLSCSPRTLQQNYEYWRGIGLLSPVESKDGRLAEIHLLYPMLTGNCRGKWKHPKTGETRYVYSCNFLRTKGGKAICKIHHIKVHMCSAYPYYRFGRQIEMAVCDTGPNPGYMKGCGYNVSKTDGFALSDFAKDKLIPLEDYELETHLVLTKIGKLLGEDNSIPTLSKKKGKHK